ncbi:HTH-type transcriptional regulator HdfR [Campylobacter majalis]|uniref:HTH-type transcriptional regulator HdfR n=1 Tax=Campylobacter majalis TaxID=2790656 RepID=A0ABN7K7U9_9BACT|nr:LysR family transcriptional regulator [Campylobacter majalis]CAD7286792.1 HTH-type transcriptional regulator HdfR [Campylobacter majalis]
MSLRHMQIAVTIAELKSFTKAAEKLGVSQPSLSKSVSLLESELGALLFDRKNGLSLTYAGEIYILKAKNLLRLNSELNSEIRNLLSLKNGKISIGVTTLSFKFIEKKLPSFYARFANADIKIIHAQTDIELLQMLKDGVIDAAYAVHFESVKDSELEYELVTKHAPLLAVPSTHIAVSKITANSNDKYPKCDLSEFKDDKFAIGSDNIRLKTGFEQIFARAGFKPNVACVTTDINLAMSMASSGICVAFGFSECVSDEQKDFISFFDVIDDENFKLSFSVVYKKSSKLIKEFIKLLKNSE